MSTTSPAEIAVKDTVVFLGAGADGAHWIVERIGELINGRQRARLRSGRSGRRRGAYLDELEPWHPSGVVDLAQRSLVAEMVAEGMVEHVTEVLVAKIGSRSYMVEVKLFDVNEEQA